MALKDWCKGLIKERFFLVDIEKFFFMKFFFVMTVERIV